MVICTEMARARRKVEWLQENLFSVWVAFLTILGIILVAMVVNDPGLVGSFKNPKTGKAASEILDGI